MPKSLGISHTAMSVSPGTLTAEHRHDLVAFYGALLGWREMESLSLPDRLTLSVGHSCYINIRERDDPARYSGYEHVGVVVGSAQAVDEVRTAVATANIDVSEMSEQPGRYVSFRFQHLLPMAVEVQYFP